MGPLGGAGADDSGVSTTNAKNVDDGPELEIRERPPSMLENVNGGPPGRCQS
jgi:hypothetical protein